MRFPCVQYHSMCSIPSITMSPSSHQPPLLYIIADTCFPSHPESVIGTVAWLSSKGTMVRQITVFFQSPFPQATKDLLCPKTFSGIPESREQQTSQACLCQIRHFKTGPLSVTLFLRGALNTNGSYTIHLNLPLNYPLVLERLHHRPSMPDPLP